MSEQQKQQNQEQDTEQVRRKQESLTVRVGLSDS